MGHYVYKYVSNGEIVYIGKNNTDLKTRINQHKMEPKFKPYVNADIYYIELANSIMADVVESELIRRYKPVLNVAKMSDWSGLEFKEPEWKKYNSKNIDIQQMKNKNGISRAKFSKSDEKRMNLCKIMYSYYCEYMLNNFTNFIENDSCYIITIPYYNSEKEYCAAPGMVYIDNQQWVSMSLGYVKCEKTSFSFIFEKEKVFQDFFDIQPDLYKRIQFMQNNYYQEYKMLCSLQQESFKVKEPSLIVANEQCTVRNELPDLEMNEVDADFEK